MDKSKKYGIVLGGGGSKGAYQIGVWKAISELEISYTAVTGTSVGALNGAFMAQEDLIDALHVWNNMDNTAVMKDMPPLTEDDNNFIDVMRAFTRQIVKKGAVDISPLEELITTMVDEDKIRKSDIDFGLVTVQIPSMQEIAIFTEDIPKGKLCDYLLASASCFPAFKAHEIDNTHYIDGGYRNNIPVDLLLKSKKKIDEIIVVDVKGVGVIKDIKSDKPIHYITSYWDLGNFLIFDGKQCRRNIQLGYLDTLKAFSHYEGIIYTFEKEEKTKLNNIYRDKLNQTIETIIENADIDVNDFITSIVTDILFVTLKDRMNVTRNAFDNSELVQYVSEICGEILELEPTLVYTKEQFIGEIENRYMTILNENIVTLNKITNEKLLSSKLLTSIGNRSIIMLAIQRRIHRLILENERFQALELVAAMFPKELMGAIFLETLIN